MDFRQTLNLPKTDFPMRANLPAREPAQLEAWAAMDLYARTRAARAGSDRFILHDGPPYANGDIHVGTALNKIVKDIIHRFWTLTGKDAPYVPGWDAHGLPIELRALRELGVSQHQIDPLRLREASAAVARRFIPAMTQQFQRLGVLADWDHPYVTMDPDYEQAELQIFADMVERGLIYRGRLPVYWCPHCETALAEAEVEYHPATSDAIFVAFPVTAGPLPPGTRAVIWTTTPWTIPANVAIAVHPDLAYVVATTAKGPLLVAADRLQAVLAAAGLKAETVSDPIPGRALEGVTARHPWLDQAAPLVLGSHVTAESGSGLVHTAPGHGREDYDVSRVYHLPMVQRLDDQGRFEPGTPKVEGLFYADANPVVVSVLAEAGALLAHERIEHQNTFCWRCKQPVIYRATEQWFLAIDQVRDALVDATAAVRFDPAWGGERMRGMIRDRQDWCLSRQRAWGLPIPAFYCEACGDAILDATLIRRVAEVIGQRGSNAWWSDPVAAFLPAGYRCPHCGGERFLRETDVFDVWMDSGASQTVLARRPELEWPASLILEGSDQYRGWFMALITEGVAARGRAPYEAVLTHGWVLDQEGREMHKSLGNTVDPLQLVERYGADIVRLWVAASEFRTDVRISHELMGQLAESYRKIRNTLRYLLGNLADYEPDGEIRLTDPLNRWAADRVDRWAEEARASYERAEFHTAVHHLIRLVTVDLSGLYLDVIKDRLYTLAPDDPLRRETQRVLGHLLRVLTIALAPILVFTSEEVYQAMGGPLASVHLEHWPGPLGAPLDPAERDRLERIFSLREVILKALEELRQAKTIGNSLQAEVTLFLPAEADPLSSADQALLTEVAMIAALTVKTGPELTATAVRTGYARCARCWRHTADVDTDELCGRCRGVLHQLGVG